MVVEDFVVEKTRVCLSICKTWVLVDCYIYIYILCLRCCGVLPIVVEFYLERNIFFLTAVVISG